MNIGGCDFHPGWQQIAVFDTETGEIETYKLSNGKGEAERFYRRLPSPAFVGLEASAPVTCVSRRPTSAMPRIFFACTRESVPTHLATDHWRT
jgi:hypothetical protein